MPGSGITTHGRIGKDRGMTSKTLTSRVTSQAILIGRLHFKSIFNHHLSAIALWKPTFTAFVLVREAVASSRSTSTGETPEYEYDQKTLQKAAFANSKRRCSAKLPLNHWAHRPGDKFVVAHV